MANIYSVPQNFSTTLNVGGGINNSQTTGIVLTSVTGLPTDGGILCFDWASTLDTSVAEYIEYTGISGNTLTGVIRGTEGLSAKAHSNGAVIAGVISQAHIKRLKERLDGTDTTANVTVMTSPKILTSINDTNGNESVKMTATASAVNEVTITNAATTGAPKVAATGDDTNIDLDLEAKGTGKINFNAHYGDIVADADGATITFNMATGSRHGVTLGGNRTLAVSNVSAGQIFFLRLLQDGTGSRTVTWFSTITWAGAAAPTLTTTANRADLFIFYAKTSSTFDGFIVGQNIG